MNRGFGQTLALMTAGTVLFLVSIWTWWPLVFVSLVPLVVGVCRQARLLPTVLWAGGTGWVMWFFLQYPLWAYTQTGIAMLSIFQGSTFLAAALATRVAWRRWRLPLTLVWPIAWVGGEYLRTQGLLSYPFGSLAGPCWEQLPLIQVAELGGIFALSFPIAMVQGLLADLILTRLEPDQSVSAFRRHRWALASVAAVWVALPAWGTWRIAFIEAGLTPGPTVAVIQPDVVSSRELNLGYDPQLSLARLQELTVDALQSSATAPELIVWPEALTGIPIENQAYYEAPFDARMAAPEADPAKTRDLWDSVRNRSRTRSVAFAQWAEQLPAPLILGMLDQFPAPARIKEAFLSYNVARVFGNPSPLSSETYAQRKIRLNIGAEYFPWANTPANEWLNQRGLFPNFFGAGSRFQPGETRTVRHLVPHAASAHSSDLAHRYLINLCSEIMLADGSSVIGDASAPAGKPFGFIVNMANEGPFKRNISQVHQFLYTAFRAVESRVGIARSSNTGISGFASPTGRVYSLVTNEAGQSRTGLGAPELPLIAEIMAFRAEHEAQFATDATLRAELEQRIARVEQLRHQAGIEGFSVDQVLISPVHTTYQRHGDWLGKALAVGLGGLTAAAFLPSSPPSSS